jgi:hypothetical protein
MHLMNTVSGDFLEHTTLAGALTVHNLPTAITLARFQARPAATATPWQAAGLMAVVAAIVLGALVRRLEEGGRP